LSERRAGARSACRAGFARTSGNCRRSGDPWRTRSGFSSFQKTEEDRSGSWFTWGRALHCLPWDADAGLKWAEMLAQLRQPESHCRSKIASLRRRDHHGLAVVTRNRADFVNSGVRIVNPSLRSSPSARCAPTLSSLALRPLACPPPLLSGLGVESGAPAGSISFRPRQ